MPKLIRILRSGKVFKELPWTDVDESFFRSQEGYMVSHGFTLVIIDERDRIPTKSFVATVKHLGKRKIDRNGAEIVWAFMTVMESNVTGITAGEEMVVKIPVDRIDRYFSAGLPNEYTVVGSAPPSAGKFIHKYTNIIPHDHSPTTTVTTPADTSGP